MNIRKFLNKIILVSAALFWAGCSGDSVTKASIDNEDAAAGSNNSSAKAESSSSNSWKYLNCSPTEYIKPIDYRDEKYKADPKEASEKIADENARHAIRDSAILRIFPDESNYSFLDLQDLPRSTPFCLFKIATLAPPLSLLYGVPFDNQLVKTVMCPDGTRFTDEYLDYEEDLKAHEEEVKAYEEQKAAYTEAYFKHLDEYYNKRSAELKSLLDSCDNHPEDFEPENQDEADLYCDALDSLEFYVCPYKDKIFLDDDEEDDEDVDENEEEEMKSSSSSKEPEEKSSSSATYGGEFAKKSIL